MITIELNPAEHIVMLAALDVYIRNWRRACEADLSQSMQTIGEHRIATAVELSRRLGSR